VSGRLADTHTTAMPPKRMRRDVRAPGHQTTATQARPMPVGLRRVLIDVLSRRIQGRLEAAGLVNRPSVNQTRETGAATTSRAPDEYRTEQR
jgi:hypothetical protein